MKLGIGIDTGGTYTDAVIYDFDNRKVVAKGKSLTTKENLEIGIGNALDSLPADLIGQASVLSLSTTLATNASVENKGGRAKLVMIGSNRKIMEWVYAGIVYGLKDEDVFCVDTNSSFDGKIIDDPDWELITAKEDEWFSDAQALAVADVYAMRNGAVSERSAKEKLTSKYAVPLVMASELANDLNVMERGATALLNAKLLPTIEEFMEAVKAALKKRHLNIKEMIVRSDGSLMSDDMALTHPVKTILSGPAASVIGGRGLTDCSDCLIVDMGGTTTDISIVQGGEPIMTDGIRIGGFRTQVRGVFIDTFGLGGDSRITVDNGKIVLNARRVQPLCIAASMFPQITDELSALVYSNRTGTLPLYEFLYLVRKPADPRRYNTKELELIRKLDKRPLMLGGGMLDLYDIKSKRLEDEGIVMRCGLT
ncbi:hydantoinase/oxoprolinase family protein, partial [Candidatus Nomurabacteria bacterium]|nr:hydantoinase/oxoprolinase family protein [Candidatus Nomurabacteria bacterium]